MIHSLEKKKKKTEETGLAESELQIARTSYQERMLQLCSTYLFHRNSIIKKGVVFLRYCAFRNVLVVVVYVSMHNY